MRIAFRTDASARIGTGHVMRCLALAEALRNRGAQIHFISRELPGSILDVIRGCGHRLHVLPAPAKPVPVGNGLAHAHWLEVPATTDAEQTRVALETLGGANLLIVDHYALDAAWEKPLRTFAKSLCVIDDLADRAHDCGLLLDQTPDSTPRYQALVPQGCRVLAGPHYALLRAEFAQWHSQAKPRAGKVRRVLICFGGVDPLNYTGRAIEALSRLGGAVPAVDVVAGMANPHAETLRAACAGHPHLRFLHAPPNLAELMAQADLAVGAGGVMLWERACLGLPCLTVVVADNQRPVMKALAESGHIVSLEASDASPQIMMRALEALIAQPDRIAEMSRRNHALVDGRGCERVARVLVPPVIELRRATESDCDSIFLWRNDENVRRHFINPDPVTRETHARWYSAILGDSQRQLLIAERESVPVGVLRYDFDGLAAIVSIYLVPGQGGRGLGPAILRSGTDWLRTNYPQLRQINAKVLPQNQSSQRAFVEAGYTAQGEGFRLELR